MSATWRSTKPALAVHALILGLSVLGASCGSNWRNKPYVPKPGTSYDPATGLPLTIISTRDQAEMILVRAGSFDRGDPSQVGRRTEVRAFYMDKREVTNQRYHRFTSATDHHTPRFPGKDAVLFEWTNGDYVEGRDSYPVVLVSYENARAFAGWAGKRLPSQKEWEYAARGAKAFQYPWGNSMLAVAEFNAADRLAGRRLLGGTMWQEWYEEWIRQEPAKRNAEAIRPVGSFPKDISPFGCVDMGGNVREWCVKKRNGRVNGFDSGESEATMVRTNGHVTCGASWLTYASHAQAWRYERVEPSLYYDVGFRCVVSADAPAIRALVRPSEQGQARRAREQGSKMPERGAGHLAMFYSIALQ